MIGEIYMYTGYDITYTYKPSYIYNSNAGYYWSIKLEQREIPVKEIPVKELIERLFANDDSVIREELKALLRIYMIPEAYVDRAEAMLKEHIKIELENRKLPTEEWLINPLYKLLVHLTYRLMLDGESNA
jgi:hypothetical protein